MKDMNISFVAIDFTKKDKAINEWKELKRTDEKLLPVNLIYPPNYPEEPAIKMESLYSPADLNLVLDRIEKIVGSLEDSSEE